MVAGIVADQKDNRSSLSHTLVKTNLGALLIFLILLLTHSLRSSAAIMDEANCQTVGFALSQHLKPPVVAGDGVACFYNADKHSVPLEQWTPLGLAVQLMSMQSSGTYALPGFPAELAVFPEPSEYIAGHSDEFNHIADNGLITSQPVNTRKQQVPEQTRNDWQLSDRHQVYTIPVSIHHYTVQFAVDPGLPVEIHGRIKNRLTVSLIYELLPYLETPELFSFFYEWETFVASGSPGDDDNNNFNNGRDSAASCFAAPANTYEEVVSSISEPASLLDMEVNATEKLLAILNKKLQQAIARGNRNLALILKDRIMLIELDLGQMENLRGQKMTRLFAAWLHERLGNNAREVSEHNKRLLRERLELHPQTVNLDPDALVIDYDELNIQEAAAYELWLDTQQGIAYTIYRKKLEQLLRDFEEGGDGLDPAMPSLLATLENLVLKFWQDLPSVPGIIQAGKSRGQGKKGGKKQQRSSRGHHYRVSGKPDTKKNGNTEASMPDSSDDNGDDEKDTSVKHTYDSACPHPDCNHGPCRESEPESADDPLRTQKQKKETKRKIESETSPETANASRQSHLKVSVPNKPVQKSKRSYRGRQIRFGSSVKAGVNLDNLCEELITFNSRNFPAGTVPKFKSSPEQGYSESTKSLQRVMGEFKSLLDKHRNALDDMYGFISTKTGKRIQLEKKLKYSKESGSHSSENEKKQAALVQLLNKENLDMEYWGQRVVISGYGILCAMQSDACNDMMNELVCKSWNPQFINRYEESISASIEAVKVNEEAMLCHKMLGQKDNMKTHLQYINTAGKFAILALYQGMSDFSEAGKQSKLRELLNSFDQCYLGWLDTYDPELEMTDKFDKIIIGMMCAFIVMDHPAKAQRLVLCYEKRLKSGEYDNADVFDLVDKLKTAFPYLYSQQSEDCVERTRSLLEGVDLLKAVHDHIIYYTICRIEIPHEALKLACLYENIKKELHHHTQCCEIEITKLQSEAMTMAEQLIREEGREAKRIQERLLKRERIRQQQQQKQKTRKLYAQVLSQNPTSQKADEPAERQDTPVPEMEKQLHPATQAGIQAYAQKKSLEDVRDEFRKVEEDPDASAFDKIQAQYAYADIVAAKLQRRVTLLTQVIEHVEKYGSELSQSSTGLPSKDTDMAFRTAVSVYRLNIQDFAVEILEMSQAFRQAWDQFYIQKELQSDFEERLTELHDEMKHLMKDGERIVDCCDSIPNLYNKRGERIRAQGLSAKASSVQRIEIKDDVQFLKQDTENIRTAINRLEEQISTKLPDKASEEKQGITANLVTKQNSMPEPEASVAEIPSVLAREIQKKTGIEVSLSQSETDVHVDTAESQIQQWLPDSGHDTHPLSLLADHLRQPLVITVSNKDWLIMPGVTPLDTSSIAIPKNALRLDYDFSESELLLPD